MKDNDIGQNTPEILIVDDMPDNVQIISLMLKTKGYKIRSALTGKLALQIVRDNPPDLILLDVNMPEMTGYEVCELQKALTDIRMLRGIIPICANCKNIRDDAGAWQEVENYVREHAEVEFSHSLCPTCAQKLYPDIEFDKDEQNA